MIKSSNVGQFSIDAINIYNSVMTKKNKKKSYKNKCTVAFIFLFNYWYQ